MFRDKRLILDIKYLLKNFCIVVGKDIGEASDEEEISYSFYDLIVSVKDDDQIDASEVARKVEAYRVGHMGRYDTFNQYFYQEKCTDVPFPAELGNYR